MNIIEKNVITGVTTIREYTQKELGDIDAMVIDSESHRLIRDKKIDIMTKRDAAIEELLMSEISIEAKAYQDAIK